MTWTIIVCPKLKFLKNVIEIFPKKIAILRYSTLFTILLNNIWSEDGMFTTYRMPCVNLNQIIYFSTFSYKIWRMGRRNWWCWPGDASPLLSALLLYSMLLWMVKGLGWSRVRKRRRRLRRKQGWPHVYKVTKQTPQLMKPNLLQTMPNK